MNDLKFYGIEARKVAYCSGPRGYQLYHYRFYSLFNGARGAWEYDMKKAKEEGEKHQEIIRLFFQYSSSLRGVNNVKKEKNQIYN